MISFDLECSNGHRFEGVFKDYNTFDDQLDNGLLNCPFCTSSDIKRLFTGCSIQARTSNDNILEKSSPNVFETFKIIEKYVKENFEYVSRDFAEVSRDMHYGLEEKRNIYGESTSQEINELLDEGINVMLLPDVETLNN